MTSGCAAPRTMVELDDFLHRKPAELSGGQRQRVALARAIVREPNVFLMDEPLSNLDAKLRVSTRAQIKNLSHELKVTTIYVTHDQIEAMTLADRVVVMEKGVVQQVGTPTEIYDRPANTFVAGFIGNPAMNLIEGDAQGWRLRGGRTCAIPGLSGAGRPGDAGVSRRGCRGRRRRRADRGAGLHDRAAGRRDDGRGARRRGAGGGEGRQGLSASRSAIRSASRCRRRSASSSKQRRENGSARSEPASQGNSPIHQGDDI